MILIILLSIILYKLFINNDIIVKYLGSLIL